MPPVEARYEGTCPECHLKISPGDTIVPNEDGKFVHIECGNSRRPSRPEVVCPTCFLIKPCGCDG